MEDQLHGLGWRRFQLEKKEGGGEAEKWSQEKRMMASVFATEAKVGV